MAELQLSLRRGAAIAATALLLASCAPMMPPAPPPYYGWYFPPPAPLPSVDAHPADHVVYGVIDAPDDDDAPPVKKIAPDHSHKIARRRHDDAPREARNAAPALPPKPAPVARVPAADNDCFGMWRICHF